MKYQTKTGTGCGAETYMRATMEDLIRIMPYRIKAGITDEELKKADEQVKRGIAEYDRIVPERERQKALEKDKFRKWEKEKFEPWVKAIKA